MVVSYTKDGVDHEIKARTAVMATPAPITHRLAVNLPAELRDALSKILYGPHVAGAFLTNETTPMPYDNTYGIAAAHKSFASRSTRATWSAAARPSGHPAAA